MNKKILFLLQHPGYLRNFESTVVTLARRGHEVVLCLNSLGGRIDNLALVQKVCADEPNVRWLSEPVLPRSDVWRVFLNFVRGCRDYLRYLTPEYAEADALRKRVEKRFPGIFILLVKSMCRLAPHRVPALLDKLLARLEQSIPADKTINDWLLAERPDSMLVTPLTDFASVQTDYVKSARAVGIPCALCVHSWDNLTNKGLMRIVPDRVYLWNEFQKVEAVAMHGVPPGQVVVTGAQCYDKWFSRSPTASYQTFLDRVGLPVTGGPLILYLCSSPFIARKEVKFVREWISALRSDNRLRDCRVLIRPHPQNAAQWRDVQLLDGEGISIWPRSGENPLTDTANNNFFESMYFCDAVVGINTSAMIEAGILGKPVFTVLAPEFKGSQEGTLHFRHLIRGGLLKLSDDLGQHLKQLSDSLVERVAARESVLAFTRNFVRPNGIDVACTPILADAIEALSNSPAGHPEPTSWWSGSVRWMIYPAACFLRAIPRRATAESGWKRRNKSNQPIYRAGLRALKFLRLDNIALNIVGVARSVLDGGRYSSSRSIIECRRQLNEISRGSSAIIVGPWLSEVGFEVLYWVPFLRWAKTEFGLSDSRIVIFSRGGAASWYEGVGTRYLDVLDCFTAEQFRKRNEERIQATGGQKHNFVSALDDELIEWAKEQLSVDEVYVLHPKLMYDLFSDFWRRRAPLNLIEQHVCFAQYTPPPSRSAIVLPENYVAVKFYFSAAFPETAANKTFVFRLVNLLALRNHVVLLNADLQLDDHRDSCAPLSERVISIASLVTPKTNLDIQSYVISRAKAFFGTYGGFSYLPLFFGVPSCSFYSSDGAFLPVHLDVAHRASLSIRWGSFDKLVKSREASDRAFRGHPEFQAVSTDNFEKLLQLLHCWE